MTGQIGRMTTGEFSRRSQLSMNALRLYDLVGLLRPATVDGRSGYRGYDESQLFPARLIVHPPVAAAVSRASALSSSTRAAADAHICEVAIPVAGPGASQNGRATVK